MCSSALPAGLALLLVHDVIHEVHITFLLYCTEYNIFVQCRDKKGDELEGVKRYGIVKLAIRANICEKHAPASFLVIDLSFRLIVVK